MENQTKQFILLEKTTKNKIKIIEPIEKPKKKRVITTTEKWTCLTRTAEQEIDIIRQIKENTIIDISNCNLILRLIQGKVSGYRSQDIDKKKLDETQIIDSNYIIDLLFTCKHKCYYCNQLVQLFYEYVREPRQWTLDRIDNDFGHNKDNVLIACLQCNLKRRIMYHERYLFTKQMTITKKGV